MESVSGIVSCIVTKAAEYSIYPIINHVKYLSNHRKNVETLKHQAEKLKVARDRVQHSVDAALRNGKEIEGDVDKWLSAVDTKILEQVEKVTQDEEKAKKKCFVGLCPNFWTRYKLSLKAAEEAKAVAELLEQGKFDEVSYPVPLQGITITPFKGYEDFESRTLVLNGIMEALNDDSVSVIGVHGMGGIGKTMLVKEIARKFVSRHLESLQLCSINTKRIWHSQTYPWLSNLKSLFINECGNLEHLLSPSLANSMVQLQRFQILDCESLREIIFIEKIEEEKIDVICFPRLNFLRIEGLRNLIFFCSRNYNIKFPLLKELEIENCPKLKEFICQTSTKSSIQALFSEKVAVPSLERMTISYLSYVKMIFDNELAPEYLTVCKCFKCGDVNH
ncbi:hypothetical protein GOBAR_DD24025 [Gossypium barbadense]|nr:hypothetical protein GOBAR_DD24025 [Gossypium barbadense]